MELMKLVLVLYTGGTIGMKERDGSLAPADRGEFVEFVKEIPQMHSKWRHKQLELSEDELVLPVGRTKYIIKEYPTLLDSSNMEPRDWNRILNDIKENYDKFDGFVILHGTDTLAYTGAALTFALENLGKPVVLTGSQVPIFESRTDAVINIIDAVRVAETFPDLQEVVVVFNRQMFLASRIEKTDNESFQAFSSPNLETLSVLEPSVRNDIHFSNNDDLYRRNGAFGIHLYNGSMISVLYLTPGIPREIVEAAVAPPMRGVLLVSFGNGNIPSNRKDITDALARAIGRGVLIVNVSQCLQGSVSDIYETGVVFGTIGVVSGSDMTIPAAYAKLAFVLENGRSYNEMKQMMQKDLKGELSRQ
ncbi:unnamed protein product [Hermetia illucens]|uniref:asparaginase n=1 Tax=Hermetia illucens TaxID=343691 RepID=A0A7R8YT09_HERIL|nr:unnamed protein product [Hermetia illucens]